MNKMDENEINATIERYNKRYVEFGYSPKTLGWLKGKQDIRFDILTSLYNFENKPEIIYRGILSVLSGDINYLIN